MATDYILFVHGVSTRDENGFRQNAQILFDRIKASTSDSSRILKPVFLFWGNVGAKGTHTLLDRLKASPKWSQLWFQNLRTDQILPFVGDAALYLSRDISGQIVTQIAEQGLKQMGMTLEDLKTPPPEDRLHLVTHSWGTVILFDILFAPRWEDKNLDEAIRQRAENVRTAFFGVGTADIKQYGIPIASIHTMGSPISLFSLINLNNGYSFNLTPKLKELLESLYGRLKRPLPWQNFAHPGDPIAYPLEGVMPLLMAESRDKVQVEDVITSANPLLKPFSQTLLPLLSGGDAHGSYWQNQDVAKKIAAAIHPKK